MIVRRMSGAACLRHQRRREKGRYLPLL